MSTIAAIATPQAAGGIAVIRISGPDAFCIADRVFQGAGGKQAASMRAMMRARLLCRVILVVTAPFIRRMLLYWIMAS